MRWVFDEQVDEWDLYVSALPFQVRGSEIANVSRSSQADPWRVFVLDEMTDEDWSDAKIAMRYAENLLVKKLEDALAEVRAGSV